MLLAPPTLYPKGNRGTNQDDDATGPRNVSSSPPDGSGACLSCCPAGSHGRCRQTVTRGSAAWPGAISPRARPTSRRTSRTPPPSIARRSQSDPENVVLLERALVLSAAAGDFDDALRYAEELLEQAPTSHAARLIIAVSRIHGKEYADVADTLGKPGAGVLADLTSALLIAWARFGEGEVDLALKDLDTLKGEDWYEPFKLLHSGYMRSRPDGPTAALEALAKARELDGNAVRITEAYARALAVAGRQDEAKDALEEFLVALSRQCARAQRRERRVVRTQTDRDRRHPDGRRRRGAGRDRRGGRAGGRAGGRLRSICGWRSTSTRRPPAVLRRCRSATCSTRAGRARRRSRPSSRSRRRRRSARSACCARRLRSTAWTAPRRPRRPSRRRCGAARTTSRAYISFGNMLRGRERFAEAAEVYSRGDRAHPDARQGGLEPLLLPRHRL